MRLVGSSLTGDEAVIVFGRKRAAIYNLGSGDVLWVGEKERKILSEVRDLSYIPNKYTAFFKALERNGVSKVSFDEKITPQERRKRYPPRYEIINVEVTSICNERCIHCYGGFGGPLKAEIQDHELSEPEFLKVIDDSKIIGFTTIQFIGAEPLARKELTLKLLRHAKKAGFSWVQLYTNGTLLDEETAKQLAANDIFVKISLYGPNADIHESITLLPGSFEKTLNAIKLLKENNVVVGIGTPLMRQNEKYLEQTKNFVESMSIDRFFYDAIRPIERGKDPSIRPLTKQVRRLRERNSPKFKISFETFNRFKNANPCLNGGITVSSFGDILPCTEIRTISLGNIRQKSLKEILSQENLLRLWYMSKDDIAICKECEFRYACFDCRAIGLATEGLNCRGKETCTYNPLTGKWGHQAN